MISLDWTLVVQLVNFLVLLLVLDRLLFRPLRGILDRREATVGSARQVAGQAAAELERLRADIDGQLAETRRWVYAHRQQAREQASREAAAILAEARDQLQRSVDQARSRIRAEADAARPRLAGVADGLANDIRDRLLPPLVS